MTLSLDISDTAAEMIKNHAALRHISVSEFVVGAVLDKIEGTPSVHRPKALDEMTKEEFDAMLERGYQESLTQAGIPVDEMFDRLYEEYSLDKV